MAAKTPPVGHLDKATRIAILDVQRRLTGVDDRLTDITGSESVVVHGSLAQLSVDDHPQYALTDGSRGLFDPVGTAAAALATAQQYADDADDVHSTADRSYADSADDAHSTADRAYTDAGVAAEATARSAGDAATLTSANAYTDTEVAVVDGVIDAHIADATDAHDGTAISYTPPASGPTTVWLTATNVDSALDQTAAQLYAPDAAATAALIAAANALATGDPLTDPNVLSSDLIVASHFLAGSVNAAAIDTISVRADILAVGVIDAGMINVTNLAAISADLGAVTAGSINIGSGTFTVDAAGNMTATSASIEGDVDATGFNLLDGSANVLAEFGAEVTFSNDLFSADAPSINFRNNAGVNRGDLAWGSLISPSPTLMNDARDKWTEPALIASATRSPWGGGWSSTASWVEANPSTVRLGVKVTGGEKYVQWASAGHDAELVVEGNLDLNGNDLVTVGQVNGYPVDDGWQTFTPVWTNLTVGNGTNTGRYFDAPGGRHIHVSVTFGSTTSLSFGAKFDPLLPRAPAFFGSNGYGMANDSGSSGEYGLFCEVVNATRVDIRYGTNNISNTSPMTWATGDTLRVDLFIPLVSA